MSFPKPYRFTSQKDLELVDGDVLIQRGYFALGISLVLGIIGVYAIAVGPLLPSSNILLLDMLTNDTHYKYLIVLLVPTAIYFVIANWVGWQYYQNS